MKFEVSETHTVCDGLVVRWKCKIWANAPEISASRNGISIAGAWPVMSKSAISRFREAVGSAAAVHLMLANGSYVKGSAL